MYGDPKKKGKIEHNDNTKKKVQSMSDALKELESQATKYPGKLDCIEDRVR